MWCESRFAIKLRCLGKIVPASNKKKGVCDNDATTTEASEVKCIFILCYMYIPDSKVYGANMGPTWGPMLAPWSLLSGMVCMLYCALPWYAIMTSSNGNIVLSYVFYVLRFLNQVIFFLNLAATLVHVHRYVYFPWCAQGHTCGIRMPRLSHGLFLKGINTNT